MFGHVLVEVEIPDKLGLMVAVLVILETVLLNLRWELLLDLPQIRELLLALEETVT